MSFANTSHSWPYNGRQRRALLTSGWASPSRFVRTSVRGQKARSADRRTRNWSSRLSGPADISPAIFDERGPGQMDNRPASRDHRRHIRRAGQQCVPVTDRRLLSHPHSFFSSRRAYHQDAHRPPVPWSPSPPSVFKQCGGVGRSRIASWGRVHLGMARCISVFHVETTRSLRSGPLRKSRQSKKTGFVQPVSRYGRPQTPPAL